MNEIEKNCDESVIKLLVGNKCDKDGRKIDE
jgi:hypothetical protein